MTMKWWYAVQRNREDGLEHGSYVFNTATHMLKAQGEGLIAVIDEDGKKRDEITYKSLCKLIFNKED